MKNLPLETYYSMPVNASELVQALNELIAKHGDKMVYMGYFDEIDREPSLYFDPEGVNVHVIM